jgi:hypothetical protein
MDSNEYQKCVTSHYNRVWKSIQTSLYWKKGPVSRLPQNYHILKYPPRGARNLWTYATCGMSSYNDEFPLELHIFTPSEYDNICEILTAAAYYHRTSAPLGLNHTVNFGQAWMPDSKCDHGLLSLPYLDGETLERAKIEGTDIRFLWLIPITEKELLYKQQNGIDALEKKFEVSNFNYVDPKRLSVI